MNLYKQHVFDGFRSYKYIQLRKTNTNTSIIRTSHDQTNKTQ